MSIIIPDFNINKAVAAIAIAALNDSGKITLAAQKMGITARTLCNYMKKYNIQRIGRKGKYKWVVYHERDARAA